MLGGGTTTGKDMTTPSGSLSSEFKAFEETSLRLGLSRFTLNQIFDRRKGKRLDAFERRCQTTQLMRIGLCGKGGVRACEEAVGMPLMDLPAETLEFMLTLKPVNTVELFMEQNRNVAAIRDALAWVANGQSISEELFHQRASVAEIVILFRKLVQMDVNLLLNVKEEFRPLAIRETVKLGMDCLKRLRALVMSTRTGGKIRAGRVVPMRSARPDRPPRITKENVRELIESSKRRR